jgi:hypothetical protein
LIEWTAGVPVAAIDLKAFLLRPKNVVNDMQVFTCMSSASLADAEMGEKKHEAGAVTPDPARYPRRRPFLGVV